MFNKIKNFTNNDYFFSLIQKSLDILCGLITISLINRYLGVSLKGQYEYILNVINVLNIVLGLGLYASYPFMKRKKIKNQMQKYLNIFSLQTLIYFLFSLIIAFSFKNTLIILSSILVIVRVINTQLQNIGIVEFIRFRQLMQIVSYLSETILTIFVYLYIPRNLNMLFLVLIIKYTIYILSYLIKCKYIPNPFNIDWYFFRFIFKFGIVAMFTTLLTEFNYNLDILVMKLFLPYSDIGLYSVGSKLAQYIWLIPDAFKEVLYSRTAKNDSVNEIKKVMRINLCITLLLIIFMIFFGKLIIRFLYGVEYLDAYNVTILIFLGIPSMVIFKIITPLYTAQGKQKQLFSILFVSVLMNTILNFILIPYLGKTGAALATVASYSLCGIVLLYVFLKKYHLKWKDCLIIKKNDIISFLKFLFK